MANCAATMHDQGRVAEAEALQRQVLEIQKRVSGPEHLETLHSMGNLAATMREQVRAAEAEALLQQVLEIQKRVLGLERPETLRSMGNQAAAISDQGRAAEAEALNQQVLEIWRRVSGLEYPDTLIALHNLALTLGAQGKTRDALTLMLSCYNSLMEKCGVDHSYTKKAYVDLSILHSGDPWQLMPAGSVMLIRGCSHKMSFMASREAVAR